MKLLIALIVSGVIFSLSLLDWRRTVKTVFFILVIEGALRKWILPQASELVYFLKDFVLLGAYIRYYIFSSDERKFIIRSNFINVLIFIVIGWCIFQAFNPSLGSLIVGIWGLKNYLFYVPLMWMIPDLFQSEEDLYKFLRSHLFLVIPVGILGIAQFASPASSPINVYAPGLEVDIATFGTNFAVRITGTFSYINNYTSYLLVCFGLLIPFFSINQPFGWRLISIIEILLVVINSFMSGSRAPVIASILLLLGYLTFTALANPGNTLRLLRWFLPSATIVSVAASFLFQSAINSFSHRLTSNKDVGDRIQLSFLEPLYFMKYKQLDSYGIGATHQATPLLRKIINLPSGELLPIGVEAEMGRILLEISPIGFILWYGLRVAIAISLLLAFWKLKRPFLRQLALAAFLIQVVWINNQLVFHPTFPIYYWFLSSFIFVLPRIEQIENWRYQQQMQLNV